MRDDEKEIIELSPDEYELVEEDEKPRSRPPPLPAKKPKRGERKYPN